MIKKDAYKMSKKNKKIEENLESINNFTQSLNKLMLTFNEDSINKTGKSYNCSTIDVVFNNEGHRSADFKKNTELLSAGCSFTFGVGLDEEFIWNNMLAKTHNMSHNSIGIPGGSCMDIVFNIFKYFEKYGHPKTLLVLFPDFGRMLTYIDGKVLGHSKMFPAPNNLPDKAFLNDRVVPSIEDRDIKYLSLPTDISKVCSPEFAYMLNSMYIRMLEVYCKNNNIDFIWFKWDPTEEIDINGGLDIFSNFYSIDYKNMLKPYIRSFYNKSIKDFCHQTEKESLEYKTTIWHIAEDNSHNGIHWQIHVKELFEQALKEKGLI